MSINCPVCYLRVETIELVISSSILSTLEPILVVDREATSVGAPGVGVGVEVLADQVAWK